MIIVKIIGGLGNQMFQYAYAKSLQNKGYDVFIDLSSFDIYKLHGGYQLDKFNIDLKLVDNNILSKYNIVGVFSKIKNKLKIKNKNCLVENSLLFDKSFLSPLDGKYIDGYFQSEKYFLEIRDILIKQFRLEEKYLNPISEKLKDMIVSEQKSCSVHVRRGDYLDSKNLSIHGICDLDYYKKSIDYIENNASDTKYFIFSDDIEWCKKNLEVKNAIFIENDNCLPHEDMYLMSLCKNNIIANSSFSWWGAWLNQNQDKIVIAPKIWFTDEQMQKQSTDIIPLSWIRL